MQSSRGVHVPYHFEWDRLNAILRVCSEGRVDDECAKSCYHDTRAAVSRTSPRAVIIDLSGVTEYEVSPSTISEIAALEPTVSDPSIPRIVVATTTYVFGMSRMLQILGGETRPMLNVVRSLAEAYAQLAVSEAHYQPLP